MSVVKEISVTNTDRFNRAIGLPIYSIDYVCDDCLNMIATDFNNTECLAMYGIENYISREEVTQEIYKSLTEYMEF